MTGKEFADYIRFMTRTNPTTFPNSNILLLANIVREELSQQILDAQEDIFLLPHYTNLLDSTVDGRQYSFPTTILSRIKGVEAKFDGTNWITLTELDITDRSYATDENTTLSKYSNVQGGAYYDLYRKSLKLLSGVTTPVSKGLKLWLNTYPAKLQDYQFNDDLVDLSVDPSAIEHGFPREFHELWARRISILYKTSREKPIALNEKELSYAVDIRTALITLRHGNEDREVFARIPDAFDRGNNGMNY